MFIKSRLEPNAFGGRLGNSKESVLLHAMDQYIPANNLGGSRARLEAIFL